MIRTSSVFAGFAVAALVTAGAATVAGRGAQDKPAAQPAANPNGWQLPPDAADKKSPVADDAKAVATGKTVFKDKCQRCHGPGGLGDGPDADPDVREDMDLTLAARAERNPDGVVFYKVMNGRKKPKMPAFKEELNEQQVWQVVAYVQSLRKKS
jgi:mono/diheme cytochrome c family protein